jgi:4'-phosphopantetheinyl transferase
VTPRPTTLWYALTSDVAEPALLRACLAVLTAEEAAKQKAFMFERHRHEYLVTRALCRGVLATYTGVAPAELVFTRSAYGQPALAPPGTLKFNLTNTVHLVACGVMTTGFAIGIDAEPLDRADDILGVAESVFTGHERGELARLPLATRRRQAVRLWTLKEAYMKARGMGMSLAPLTFEIGFAEHAHLRHVDDGDLPSRWELTTREIEGHLVATCIERIERIDADAATPRHAIVTRHADLAALLLPEG